MIAEPTIIDQFYYDFQIIVSSIDPAEIHLRNTAEETLRKSLLIATASHFERELTELVSKMAHAHSAGSQLVAEFIQNKAIKRQYHTYFDWNARNANSFFGLFGKEFRAHMTSLVSSDTNLRQSIVAFLELGRDRNLLVHEDFANFNLEKTRDEIFQRYVDARLFVSSLKSAFDEFAPSHQGNS